jgi:hypothetical protein
MLWQVLIPLLVFGCVEGSKMGADAPKGSVGEGHRQIDFFYAMKYMLAKKDIILPEIPIQEDTTVRAAAEETCFSLTNDEAKIACLTSFRTLLCVQKAHWISNPSRLRVKRVFLEQPEANYEEYKKDIFVFLRKLFGECLLDAATKAAGQIPPKEYVPLTRIYNQDPPLDSVFSRYDMAVFKVVAEECSKERPLSKKIETKRATAHGEQVGELKQSKLEGGNPSSNSANVSPTSTPIPKNRSSQNSPDERDRNGCGTKTETYSSPSPRQSHNTRQRVQPVELLDEVEVDECILISDDDDDGPGTKGKVTSPALPVARSLTLEFDEASKGLGRSANGEKSPCEAKDPKRGSLGQSQVNLDDPFSEFYLQEQDELSIFGEGWLLGLKEGSPKEEEVEMKFEIPEELFWNVQTMTNSFLDRIHQLAKGWVRETKKVMRAPGWHPVAGDVDHPLKIEYWVVETEILEDVLHKCSSKANIPGLQQWLCSHPTGLDEPLAALEGHLRYATDTTNLAPGIEAFLMGLGEINFKDLFTDHDPMTMDVLWETPLWMLLTNDTRRWTVILLQMAIDGEEARELCKCLAGYKRAVDSRDHQALEKANLNFVKYMTKVSDLASSVPI